MKFFALFICGSVIPEAPGAYVVLSAAPMLGFKVWVNNWDGRFLLDLM